MPIKKPMMEPRQIGPLERRHSSRVIHSLPVMRMAGSLVPEWIFSRPRNTSASANMPTTTTMKPMPS